MPKDVSRVVPTAWGRGAQKLGQPVPLSNFVVEENKSRSQPAQAKLPVRFSCSSGLVNGISVALSRYDLVPVAFTVALSRRTAN